MASQRALGMPSRTRAATLPRLALAVLMGIAWHVSFQQPFQTFAMYAKRPKNAYMHFSGEKRGDFQEEGMSIGDLGKKLGEAWRSMSATARKPYEKMAVDDKKRYELELKQGLVPKERRSKAKKEGKPKKEGPKRPMSAYIAYVKDKHGETAKAGQSPTEVMKALGAQWKKLAAAKRKPYEKLAAADKARYDGELEAYTKELAAVQA
mmetsp:Transcript_49021/g.131189  ORF Transcript_49021/g.131189 Transcript_49021/m.131189 type:complete len:207 (-) Transcript_49021:179-799(-)